MLVSDKRNSHSFRLKGPNYSVRVSDYDGCVLIR